MGDPYTRALPLRHCRCLSLGFVPSAAAALNVVCYLCLLLTLDNSLICSFVLFFPQKIFSLLIGASKKLHKMLGGKKGIEAVSFLTVKNLPLSVWPAALFLFLLSYVLKKRNYLQVALAVTGKQVSEIKKSCFF